VTSLEHLASTVIAPHRCLEPYCFLTDCSGSIHAAARSAIAAFVLLAGVPGADDVVPAGGLVCADGLVGKPAALKGLLLFVTFSAATGVPCCWEILLLTARSSEEADAECPPVEGAALDSLCFFLCVEPRYPVTGEHGTCKIRHM
jgi:hypothetical protein